MKVQAKISPTIILEITGESQVDVFDQLATATEVFGEKCCGQCQETNLSFVKRVVEEDPYYELLCNKCGAKLSMGQSKKNKGQLFPIRKIIQDGPEKGRPNRKLGVYDTKNKGWTKYKGKPLVEEE